MGSRVFLVRHGETEWSRNGRHTGRTDLPLTDRGRAEARRAGSLLAGRSFSAVLSSPLARALETARLAGYGEQAEICNDLLEWDYGELEGRTTADIQEEMPGWLIWRGPVPGGESLAEVATRADRVVEQVRCVGGDVLVFAHGHILRVLTARWCELDAIEGRRFTLDTASPGILGWEHDYPALRGLNIRASAERKRAR